MRKKYYLVLDTETATLPFTKEMDLTPKQKQSIAIAKPLIYDIGWVIVDRTGNEFKRVNYLVQETFFVPNVFNTAYYKDKRPIYMEMLNQGLITPAMWNDIVDELLHDLMKVDFACAYNACFDFKKAIPFTEKYIDHLYDIDYNEWEYGQRKSCEKIANGEKVGENPNYLDPVFNLRDYDFPIADLWGIACDRLINIDKYRNYCLDNGLLTNSALYFKSSAETSFQYLLNQHEFVESHTALDDSLIEAQILAKALKKGKIEPYIKEFPFKDLGTTYEYAQKKPKYKEVVRNALEEYAETLTTQNAYATRIETILCGLQ